MTRVLYKGEEVSLKDIEIVWTDYDGGTLQEIKGSLNEYIKALIKAREIAKDWK